MLTVPQTLLLTLTQTFSWFMYSSRAAVRNVIEHRSVSNLCRLLTANPEEKSFVQQYTKTANSRGFWFRHH